MKDPLAASKQSAPDPGSSADLQDTDHRPMAVDHSLIQVQDLTLAYGSTPIMRDLNFEVAKGEVLIIMGGSGSGKSSLLKSMIGLLPPVKGKVLYKTTNFWSATDIQRQQLRRRMGVLYQNGALWSSMTLAENIALPLEVYTELTPAQIGDIASLKLNLVGLAGQEEIYPASLSGGMRKRAALARAMALDPELLFFDEPSSGLDPISARRLDELILELQSSLGTTMVVVTHDLDSIFTIGTRAVFLDAAEKTMTEIGDPRVLRDNSPNQVVREFLSRSESRKQKTQAQTQT